MMEMWGIQVAEIGAFQFLRLPVRPPQRDEVLIRVAVTGLCRTDLKLIRVGHRDLLLPRVPGEEVVGEIVEKGADVRGLECGDLVYVYPGLCGAGLAQPAATGPRTSAGTCASWAFTATADSPSTSPSRLQA